MGTLLAFALAPASYAAWDFVPTAQEWRAWPVYCRVQFATVSPRLEAEFGDMGPSRAMILDWRQKLDEDTFDGMHHWCASIHFLSRAKLESDPGLRGFTLNRALDDAMYSFVRSNRLSLVYPNMAVTVAQILDEQGKSEDARKALQRGMAAQPQRPEPYVALAMLSRKGNRLAEGRDFLRKADEVTGGESAEIQYNLGLFNFEMGDFAAAAANARKAYSLGYPLPGLRNKLKKAGHWSAEHEPAASPTN